MGADNQSRTAPERIPLIPYGRNSYTRDGKSGEFNFTERDADAIIAEFTERARDLVIDYEHQTLAGSEAPAAGWINELVKTPDGLEAGVKYWTDHAKARLESGEYRYFSPVLIFGSGGGPSALHSVALTNHPALHGVPALVANDFKPAAGMNPVAQTRKDSSMNQTEQALRKLLGESTLALSDDTDAVVAGKLLALAEELPGLRAAAAERDQLKQTQETSRKKLLLDDATAKNKITNGVREALEKLPLEQLSDILDKLPENGSGVPTGKLPEEKEDEGKDKAAALTDKEKEMARKMNLTDEEFLAVRKANQEEEE